MGTSIEPARTPVRSPKESQMQCGNCGEEVYNFVQSSVLGRISI